MTLLETRVLMRLRVKAKIDVTNQNESVNHIYMKQL